MDTFLLYKSDKPDKKYVMIMPKFGHSHYFGASAYRDFTLMNDKNSKFYEPSKEERDKVKKNYLARHAKDPKGIHSPSTLSDMILWNKPTVKAGVKDYEKKYKVKVKIINEKYSK
tara:strand:- start:176 stop:520 length:345 start_codon:yes stop_codon:yes gene_type:complete